MIAVYILHVVQVNIYYMVALKILTKWLRENKWPEQILIYKVLGLFRMGSRLRVAWYIQEKWHPN